MNLPIWNSLAPRTRRITLWGLGLLLCYTITGFLILPPIVRSVAAKQVARQLDREVSIQAVKINPFTLSTTVRGLMIKDKDGEPFLSWDTVYVNFQLSSFFGKAWVFKQISIVNPFVRAEMNKDGTFNFTDLIAKFSTNNARASTEPSKPLLLHIGQLEIRGATASVADFAPRTPFKRTIGPLNITLEDFQTDPDNKNPYSFAGTTDAGERISWSGFFYLGPLRSQGELKLFNFDLNKYAPLYQDFVRFKIAGGTLALDVKYRINLAPTNRVAEITDSAVGMRDFRLAEPDATNPVIELPAIAIAGVSADLQDRRATVKTIIADGAKVFLSRNQDAALNVVELARPVPVAANEAGGILTLLRSVTNAVNRLLESTNQWKASVASVNVTNCAVHFVDHVNVRPAHLDLSDIALTARNISNLPGTNLEATLSLNWNTNGSIKVATSASLLPPTADVQLDLDQLDLGTLDPYLEPKLNLFILGSKLGLHGTVHLRTPNDRMPEVTFNGDASLNDFHTVDGVFGQDLVKWDALRFNGIAANLNPPSVAVKQIDVDKAYARVIIETNHTINLLNALRPANTNAPAPGEINGVAAKTARADARRTGPQTAGTRSPLPQISIGAIVLTNTALSFNDRSIQPEVNLSIRDVNGEVAGLSTKELQHAEIHLAAKVDGVGPADITGTINPFSGTETNHIRIAVKDVDLTPASPYAGKFAGYGIAEGKLNLELNYELAGKKLTAKNVITLDQFNFGEKVNSPDATHLPVRLAVAILKDRDGKIVLDVPVEGSLDDPKFRVGKVVTRAIVNLLTKVATSPFSLIGAMFGGGGEELGYQEFDPGSSRLTASDLQKLDTLQKALHQRPALRLEITGGIDPEGDREGLQRAALDQQIRTRVWQDLNRTEQATNSVEQIALPPEIRQQWIKKLYDDAVSSGKITPEFLAAHTNLAVFATTVQPKKQSAAKGATLLLSQNPSPPKTTPPEAGYQTKLVPPPDAYEAVLLATIPVTADDLKALAAARAARVRDYLVETKNVEAGRVFLKSGAGENLRKDGSRAWLQLQ